MHLKCSEVTTEDALLKIISSFASCLYYLNLTNSEITEAIIMAILDECCDLRDLQLSYCRHLTSLTVDKISETCPDLEILNLAWLEYCGYYTDASILKLADGYPFLIWLNLASCHLVSDIWILEIKEKCDDIPYLNFSSCDISNISLLKIAERCPCVNCG